MPLYESAIDCKEWLDAYTERAYGAKSESAYGKGTNGVEFSSVIAARPAINVKKAGDLKTFKLHRERFLELLLDTDKMLASPTEWNFDKWVNDARSWGTTSKEKDQLEEDATSLVTFWGFTEGYNCIQFDYSWREWAGLLGDCIFKNSES